MKKYIPLLIILVVISFLFLFRLNRDLLGDWDECVIATQAREMKITGNFITNQFDGNFLFEKPPANNWWMQIPLIFSSSEFSYRFSVVIFSILIIVLVYIFCLNYFSLFVAIASCLLLLTNWLFVDFSTKVNTDIGFTFFTFLGFYLWILSYKKSWFCYLSGLAFGLAVLTKGLSIFPYLIAIFIWEILILICHPGRSNATDRVSKFKPEILSLRSRMTMLTRMGVAFLLTILPWHIWEYMKFGQEFITVYFVQHLINRAKYPLDFHFEGRLFYAKNILKDFNVWLISLVMIPVYFWKEYVDCFSRQGGIAMTKSVIKKNEILVLILLSVILPLISITAVRTRIAWYALPIYPFIAITISFCIEKIIEALKFKYKNYIFGIIVIILSVLSLSMINQKMRIFDDKRVVATRDEVFLKTQNLDTSDINYLVWESERTAEAILPKEFRTNTTFLFGGNPCAVFYSDKKINYFYSIDKFVTKMKTTKGYYVVYKDDLKYIEKLKFTVIFKNNDYFLLKY